MGINQITQHGVMVWIQNKRAIENRVDFFKKNGYEKSMNVDFMGNVCKHVMKYAQFLLDRRKLESVWVLKGYV